MGLEHVETQVASGDSSIDFTNVFDGTADRYVLYCDNLITDSSDETPYIRLSSDGGSTWDSGSSDYAFSIHQTIEDGTTGAFGSGGADAARLNLRQIPNSPASNNTYSNVTTIHEPENASRATALRNKTSTRTSTPSFDTEMSGGERLTQSAIDSLQFLVKSDNISSGIFSLYAVTETSAGAKDHIETIEANSQASVDFTNVFGANDGYDRYEIHADNMLTASGSADDRLSARVSSDGGGTWDSGASDYARTRFFVSEAGSTAAGGSSGTSAYERITYRIGDTASDNESNGIKMTVSEPTNSNRATVMRTDFTNYNTSVGASYNAGYTGAIRLTQSAIDSIQFYFPNGDIASGTFSVYGIGQ